MRIRHRRYDLRPGVSVSSVLVRAGQGPRGYRTWPLKVGTYEIRLLMDDGYRLLAISNSFKIVHASSPGRQPSGARGTVVTEMSPVLIIALVVVALIAVAYIAGLRPAPRRGGRPTPGILRRRSKWRKVLPVLPLLAAVGCLALAFTGFRLNFQETSPVIMLVMDASDSMEATDVAPNRLQAAESAAIAFLDELPPEFRVGLTTFAGDARIVVQPTQNRDEVANALEALTTSRGTVIGDGLTEALDVIEEIRVDAPDTPGAAVLLSDGRDTGSLVPPDEAAARAASLEIPVFTVLVGRANEEGGQGADAAALEAIADASGGDAFTAQTSDQLTSIYANLGSELSVDLDVQPSTTPLVIAAIALTVLAGLMLIYQAR
jgi:Ca-activated chloride channel family protein